MTTNAIELEAAIQQQRSATTMCEAFQRTAAQHAGRTALTVDGGPDVTWNEYRDRAARLAGGLAALGVRRGETVATMLLNRPEFFLVDTATLVAGGTPLAVYNTSPPEEIAHVLADAAPRVVVTELAFEPVVRRGITLAGLTPEVVTVGATGAGGFASFEAQCPADFDAERAWRSVLPEDVALIIYTSGTTGRPKGVQLTHRNLMAAWGMILAAEPRMAQLDRVISYLPTAHLADRTFSYHPAVHTGATITCVPDPRQIGAVLPTVRPSMFLGVPRIWEKLRIALAAGASDGASAAQLRASVGLDENPVLWTGAAPLDVDVLSFFDSIGLPILEGYGMSETSAVITTNRRADRRHGTVGRALPGVEIDIADDGEILVRGANVTPGYRNMPEQTAEAIDTDGWLHTGDVGVLDADGFLAIVDRKKELVINSAGKNMSPAQIENALRSACHLVGPVVAIGDRRPYVTALVTLDPDEVRVWATARGIADVEPADLAGDPDLNAVIAAAVVQANSRLARVAQIKRFRVLPDVWEPASGLVTPTLKLKRRAVEERYAQQIEDLYR